MAIQLQNVKHGGIPVWLVVALASAVLGVLAVIAGPFPDERIGPPAALALAVTLPFCFSRVRRAAQNDCTPPGDIGCSERRRLEAALAVAEEILANTEEAVVVTNRHGVILRVNRAYSAITGYAENEVCGRRPQLLDTVLQDKAFYSALRTTLRRAGRWSGELLSRRKNGETYPQWLTIVAVRDATARITRYVAIASDISRRKGDEALIEQMRNFDPLTGLPNWEILSRRLRDAIDAARSGSGQVAVLFVDVDHFKRVNDTLGHGFGDYIIEAMAERLVRCVGEANTVARRGSDEFCILLQHIDAAEAAAVADRVLLAVAEPLRIFEQEYVLTASIGISLFPGDGDDAATLISRAGSAMDLAKQEGRNNFQFFTGELDSATLERLAIDKGLYQAIERGEFVLHYQPQVSLASGQVVGVEALIRWRHPEMGMISPVKFIPLAEETGKIVAIGEWVLHEACRQARAWHDAGYTGLQMAVNLSPRQFRQADLAQRIEETLAASGLAAEFLELEITEGVLMADPAMAAAVLQRLKLAGIRFSVDDFGTGYSSLGYLKRFPLDRLKIDRSFVSDCCNNRHDAAIVSAVIALARSLDLEVIAEGVENVSQLAFLDRQRCDFVQGYLFSPPLSAAQMTELLAETGAYLPDPLGAAA